jgi:hypothetical protein
VPRLSHDPVEFLNFELEGGTGFTGNRDNDRLSIINHAGIIQRLALDRAAAAVHENKRFLRISKLRVSKVGHLHPTNLVNSVKLKLAQGPNEATRMNSVNQMLNVKM